MTSDTTQNLDHEDGLFDNDWTALLKAAIASGPAALRALFNLLNRLFPLGHSMIRTVKAELDKAEADEEEARRKLRRSMGP